jgi:glutathione S-transferase
MGVHFLNDATSPFGRKVIVAALERAIQFTEEFVDLASPEGALGQSNPLWQIPVLVTTDGRAIYDSATILLYLETQHGDPPLVPEEQRWPVLTRASLSDGLMEAVLFRIMELRRPDNEQSASFVKKLEARIERSLATLDAEVSQMPTDSALLADQIAAACALEYTDFRFTRDWRSTYTHAARWLDRVSDRESLRITAPPRSGPLQR